MPSGTSGRSMSNRHAEDADQPKRPAKREKRVRANIIIQSQDDGEDEVVWKLSPTAERLQSTASGGPESRAMCEGRSVLQPCQAANKKCEPVLEILSKTSTSSNSNSSKKKKSPGMAGKLEMWLSSSQQLLDSKPRVDQDGGIDLQDADKENDSHGRALNNSESKKGVTPTNSKIRASSSKRPSTSSQRRSSNATKKSSTSVLKGATNPPGQRRKALLDLLDKVDDAVKGSIMLVQTKLSFSRKGPSTNEDSDDRGCQAMATGKQEKVYCETVLIPPPQPVPAHTIDEEALQQNSLKEIGDNKTEALSKVKILDIRSESNDAVQPGPLARDLNGLDNVSNDLVTPHRMSCDPSLEQAPQQNSLKEIGDNKTEALSKVKILDIRNESNDAVQPGPLARDLNGLDNVSNDLVIPHRMSCDPSLEQAPQQNSLKELGDNKTEALSKVKILDIMSESNDAVQPGPLARDLNGLVTPHRMSCDPSGSGVPKNLASIQFLVLEVAEGEHKDPASLSFPQKTLTLLDEQKVRKRVVHLRDTWFHALVKTGDIVNVIGDFDKDGECVIDREHNLMVINPDLLVSGSKVGSSFYCARRAVFEERIKSNDISYAALMGTMLHQLFQVALRSECPTFNILNDEVKVIIQSHLDGLYASGVSDREASAKLVAAIPPILSWWKQFVGLNDSAAQEIEFGKIHGTQPVSVKEVVDIEEMVWSPKYGLKGMIDASVFVKMGNMTLGGEGQIMPFELKTGKATTGQASTEHRAQVILYTLLMSDRYMQSVKGGLLYYLHTNQTQGVDAHQPELAGLIMQRNEHAHNLLKTTFDQRLPPMLQNSHKCQNCQQLDTCTIYHKAQDGGTGESSGLGELFDRSTNHLSKAHLQFFQQWDRLINLEARNGFASQSEIWRMPSGKKEEQGRCISSLVLDTSAENDYEQRLSKNSFTYRFRRAPTHGDTSSHATQSSQASLQSRSFSCGDYVILSTENGHSGVAGGTILNVSKDSVLLRLAHRLRIPGSIQATGTLTPSNTLWRIDKDEKASHLAIMRFNLLQLFVKANGDAQRRSLIVDLQAPKFENALPDSDPAAVYLKSISSLNDDQMCAIRKIVMARDYAMILGMPGTGKTSTVVHAVIALLARKAKVLLTSYTNSAVDNILLRLKKLGVDFVRVGRPEAIHSELRDKAIGGMEVKSVKEFQSVMEKAQVVGVTCLGINHPLFAKHKFDVCIVDEAGQITLPVCLGPLRYARSFVLVGDHYQLPPLVRSLEARDEGMAISLFRRLSERHPQSVSVLQSQYRMCSGIMALSNSLIYNNRLLCGSPQVATASLQVHQTSRNFPAWLSQVVDPMQPLLFLDTDNLQAEELRIQNNVTNPTEGTILLRIVKALLEGGVDIEKIGVISPYNAQVDLIQRLATKEGFSDLEVHTVDKYQGREKDCVVISFVRSNSQHRISLSLLADWRRINVAITRAKTKLVMVGSHKTLSSTPILRLLMEKVAEVGSLLPLPSNATINIGW